MGVKQLEFVLEVDLIRVEELPPLHALVHLDTDRTTIVCKVGGVPYETGVSNCNVVCSGEFYSIGFVLLTNLSSPNQTIFDQPKL